MQESYKAICTHADNATVSQAVTLLESLGIELIVDYSNPASTRLLVPTHLFNSSLQSLLRAGIASETRTDLTPANRDRTDTSLVKRSAVTAVGDVHYPK